MPKYNDVVDFLKAYSDGVGEGIAQPYYDAMRKNFGTRTVKDGNGKGKDVEVVNLPRNIWIYNENGVLEKLTPEETTAETMMTNMLLHDEIYVVPGVDQYGKPDFTHLKTISVVQVNEVNYVQVMDAAKAKEAYENKPVAYEPGWLDKLLDFFCKLVGSRNKVCALWDNREEHEAFYQTVDQVYEMTKDGLDADLRKELLSGDYTRQEKQYNKQEQADRENRAKELTQKNKFGSLEGFDPELTEWYLAMYEKSHDMFPEFIPEGVEVDMTKMDQQAMRFAGDKLNYLTGGQTTVNEAGEVVETDGVPTYTISEDLTGSYRRFDVRTNIVTTLAFALTADKKVPAEDVFKFLAGEEVPALKGLGEKMDAEMAKFSDPKTRNSSKMHSLLQKGTDRMANLLENRENLQDAISYQLGNTLYRNQLTFSKNNTRDVSMDLKVSPLAKQITKLQSDIQNSYNADILQGYALNGGAGEQITALQAEHYLPINAVGQTNAAFLEKLSKEPANNRMQFIKGNMHVLENMNEQLDAYIRDRLDDENCTWVKSPENLKKAINGGIIKEYQTLLTDSLRKTGKVPVFKNSMERLMDTSQVMVDQDVLDLKF